MRVTLRESVLFVGIYRRVKKRSPRCVLFDYKYSQSAHEIGKVAVAS